MTGEVGSLPRLPAADCEAAATKVSESEEEAPVEPPPVKLVAGWLRKGRRGLCGW